MPDDALPQPWPTPPAGLARLRRTYRDALRRPMRGTLTLTGAPRAETADAVQVAAPVDAVLVGGVLDELLPPGEYTITGTLHTVDNARVEEESTVTLR